VRNRGYENFARVLQATSGVPNRTRCYYSEIPNLSLHPRNSGERSQIKSQEMLSVTNIRDNSMRLDIETSPVGCVNRCSRYHSNAYMRAQWFLRDIISASMSGNEGGKATYGKVNVCQMRISHAPWLYNAAPTGNTGFMNFARKPFLLTSSKWGVKPLSK
jgi:hypothetical protein